MDGNQIRFQGIVWTFGKREFAALLVDGHSTNEPDALPRASRARGLPLTTDIRRVPLTLVPGWRIEATFEESALGTQVRLTVHWPHIRPLISLAGVDLPQRWQQLAVTQRSALLLIGRDLVAHDGALPARVARLAESGELAAGFVSFRSGNPAPRAPHLLDRPDRRHPATFVAMKRDLVR
ncbi:hypothetical protein ACFQ05_32770 [Amycolatopsis umgeniensis]|uniref:Uncharacterized protein n=1 Tax=Amycolatopsis umgeniensis TaxID=336628 RepID=A0A841AP59_9PSEU|nr:hypothetical protein [Amycolatopsis umgeniensis]MBB5850559.1 hypothetical protein [Amycolatopsis umgeniensis]